MAIKIKGNIENLLDYQKVENNEHPTMGNRCFASMFKNNKDVVEAPTFPANVLSDECYVNMFANCSLTVAPTVSATIFGINSMTGFLYNNSATAGSVYEGVDEKIPFEYYSNDFLTFKTSDGSAFYIYVELTEEERQGQLNGTISLNENLRKVWDGEIEISTDKEHWTTWLGDDSGYAPNGVLYMRGRGNTYVTKYIGGANYHKWICSVDGNVDLECTGNIETLLDYEKVSNGEHPTMGTGCFYGLFRSMPRLTKAPYLPAKQLAPYCYCRMFANTAITTAPELPATELKDCCYMSMFINCQSLTKTPNLHATILGDYCYSTMFKDCISLKQSSTLPATELKAKCYGSMFENCSSLTNFQTELPATTLTEGCYQQMFFNCTSLTQAPSLPATTVAKECYMNMFNKCTSLTTVPKALPAINLEEDCYRQMFFECTSLTQAPELHALNLAKNCYYSMFSECTSLIEVPNLPAIVLADNCYTAMFTHCNALTQIFKLFPATELAEGCYDFMFIGCDNLHGEIHCPAIIENNEYNLSNQGSLPETVTVVYDL